MEGVIDLLYLVVPPLVALLAIRRRRHRGEAVAGEVVLERYLFWYLIIAVGVSGVLDGVGQMFDGEDTAELNEWAYSPFVIELGFTNFAFGVIGLLCIKVKGTWWYAAGVGYSIFLALAAYYHVYDWLGNGNDSSGNIGPTLWADIGVAVVVPVLCYFHARSTARTTNARAPLTSPGS
jgi:hypothetical protein